MNARQERILRLVIEAYVDTAEPIGSKWLSERSDLGVSPATVRNDMAALEADGFLAQPHTSSGRVPTEKAYARYVRECVHARHGKRVEARLRRAAEQDEAVKAVAKTMTDLSGEMVIVAFDPSWSYYTGVSNLMRKPDFSDIDELHSVSALVDRFDEILGEVARAFEEEIGVFIGSENPFGAEMSALIVRYRMPRGGDGLLGIVGPLRMNYRKNLGLVTAAAEALNRTECTYG